MDETLKNVLLGAAGLLIQSTPGVSAAVGIGMNVGELLSRAGIDTSSGDFPEVLERMAHRMEIRAKDGSEIDAVYAGLQDENRA